MAVLIMAVLIGIFSRYTLTLFGKVEKTLVDRTVLNIDTALDYHASFAVMNHDFETLNQLLKMNPMDLMMNSVGAKDVIFNKQKNNVLIPNDMIMPVPSSYSGLVFDDSDTLLESGRWFFDQDDSFLFYKLNNSEFFTSDIDGPARVRYKVRLQYTDENENGVFDSTSDKFISLKLQAIDIFEWSFN